ncbi:MAG: hypothetical protein ABJA33_06600 [Pedococcus sp.]
MLPGPGEGARRGGVRWPNLRVAVVVVVLVVLVVVIDAVVVERKGR